MDLLNPKRIEKYAGNQHVHSFATSLDSIPTPTLGRLSINLCLHCFWWIRYHKSTYVRIEAASTGYWALQRYHLICEFVQRSPLPPPLILLWHFYLLIKYLVRRCRREHDLNYHPFKKSYIYQPSRERQLIHWERLRFWDYQRYVLQGRTRRKKQNQKSINVRTTVLTGQSSNPLNAQLNVILENVQSSVSQNMREILSRTDRVEELDRKVDQIIRILKGMHDEPSRERQLIHWERLRFWDYQRYVLQGRTRRKKQNQKSINVRTTVLTGQSSNPLNAQLNVILENVQSSVSQNMREILSRTDRVEELDRKVDQIIRILKGMHDELAVLRREPVHGTAVEKADSAKVFRLGSIPNRPVARVSTTPKAFWSQIKKPEAVQFDKDTA
ncbi:hypothetical protein AHF37_07509 [Paragonimus kellicotti]|nr:hypothetical protein AHF37_07509 [Paragonimus kellicotti]